MKALEIRIGQVLRVGTFASSLLLAAGLAIALLRPQPVLANRLLQVGLIILLATPAARVVVSVVEYIRDRDWLFVALTLIVLVALAGSLVAASW